MPPGKCFLPSFYFAENSRYFDFWFILHSSLHFRFIFPKLHIKFLISPTCIANFSLLYKCKLMRFSSSNSFYRISHRFWYSLYFSFWFCMNLILVYFKVTQANLNQTKSSHNFYSFSMRILNDKFFETLLNIMKLNWIFIKCILKLPNCNRIFIKLIIKSRN